MLRQLDVANLPFDRCRRNAEIQPGLIDRIPTDPLHVNRSQPSQTQDSGLGISSPKGPRRFFGTTSPRLELSGTDGPRFSISVVKFEDTGSSAGPPKSSPVACAGELIGGHVEPLLAIFVLGDGPRHRDDRDAPFERIRARTCRDASR
jgi:hypothetical protein